MTENELEFVAAGLNSTEGVENLGIEQMEMLKLQREDKDLNLVIKLIEKKFHQMKI